MTVPRWFSLALVLLCAHLVRCFSIASPFRAARPPTLPDLYEASVLELQAGLDTRQFTSVDLVKVDFG
jgi:amidase